jgi:hypothetical protein
LVFAVEYRKGGSILCDITSVLIIFRQAHKMDTPDLSVEPHISSTVDDTFYLLKLVLNRLVSTGNLSILTSMRERISTIVERDYLGVLQKKMDAVYSGSGVVSGFGSSLAGLTNQGREVERERRERDLRTSFAVRSGCPEVRSTLTWPHQVLLNDLDISAQYMERLIDDLIGSESANQTFLETELPEVEEQMRDLGDLAGRMRAAAKASPAVGSRNVVPELSSRTASTNCSTNSLALGYARCWKTSTGASLTCWTTTAMPRLRKTTWCASALSRVGHRW